MKISINLLPLMIFGFFAIPLHPACGYAAVKIYAVPFG
jgi:hypothetical protein